MAGGGPLRNRMKILLLLFFTIVIVPTIVLADLGRLPGFLAAVYAFPDGDKVGHFVLYGVLAFLLVIALPSGKARGRWKTPLLACGLLVVAIGVEEISQILLATRSADVLDFACSVLGVALFGCVAWRIKCKKLSTKTDG
jgi:hypothetical protein